MIKILLLMFLCHIIDDFVLQPICLSKLKQKEWWEHNASSQIYKNDYKMALLVHSISWSIMVLLPLMFFTEVNSIALFFAFIINVAIHYVVDNAKANLRKINLCTDQLAHFLQIIITCIILNP